MADLNIQCPHCAQDLEVPREIIGEGLVCPACKGHITLKQRQPRLKSAPKRYVQPPQHPHNLETDSQKPQIGQLSPPESELFAPQLPQLQSTVAQRAILEGIFMGVIAGGILAVLLFFVFAPFVKIFFPTLGNILQTYGVVACPVLGLLKGLTHKKGNCPWCGISISAYGMQEGVDCRACKKRIVIRDNRFLKVE